jgi:oligosaccharide repeat unit polymerase
VLSILRILILIAPFVLVCVIALRNQKYLEIFPSLFWFFFMVLPFFYLDYFIDSKILNTQFIGILAFTLFFNLSDFLAMKLNRKSGEVDSKAKIIVKKDSYRLMTAIVISILLLAIPFLHYTNSKSLPLADLIFGGKGGIALTESRQEFTKGAHFSLPLQLLIAWYIPVIASLGIFFLWKLKSRTLVVFSFLLAALYSVASLEKIPSIFLVLCLVLGFTFISSSNTKRALKILVSVISLLSVLNILGFTYVHQSKMGAQTTYSAEFESKKLEGVVTPSDTYRFFYRIDSSVDGPLLGLTYRAILTPIDVSFRWYQYYNTIEKQKRNLENVLLLRENPKASNIVGRWAFTSRFPEKYTEYNNSYSSIDADSYAIGGYLGIFISGLVLIILRLLFKYLSNNSDVGKFIYGICIAYLSIMPFQSGIMSILISKGLLALFLVSFLFSKSNKLTATRIFNI